MLDTLVPDEGISLRNNTSEVIINLGRAKQDLGSHLSGILVGVPPAKPKVVAAVGCLGVLETLRERTAARQQSLDRALGSQILCYYLFIYFLKLILLF